MTLEEFLEEWNNGCDQLLVHTSGSTGKPKPLWVEKRRMLASAHITCDFLGLKKGDTALLCMPLDYIAGKMMVVRALERGMTLVSIQPTSHPMADPQISDDREIDFAAMVPLQVWNTLQVESERRRLMNIRHLIIGGGAIDEALEKELQSFPNAVWSTYGMTETLSHIALRRLNGKERSQWYKPFSTVGIGQDHDGCLTINAPLVCSEPQKTNDIAEVAPDGSFRIIGRRDNVICSGGIKIQMEEVEQRLRQFINVPFMITKAPDEKYGEIVVMLIENGNVADAERLCRRHLPRYWFPRIIKSVSRILYTETGKPRRQIELYL